jgi:hypothetical protein
MASFFDVSLVATVVGALLGFFLGALWYGPLFGKAWLAENRFTPEVMEGIKQTFSPLKVYGGTFVLGLISSYAFGVVIGPRPALSVALLVGLGAGACWVAAAFASTYLWEFKTLRHFLINGGYHTIRFSLIGLAFGLLG